MKNKLLLTGKPQVGKTAIIQNVLTHVNVDSLTIGGFYTREIRENGNRVGFNVETILSKEKGILAHVDFNSSFRVGKYGVNKYAFEKIMLKELNICTKNKVDLIIIDEIGKMEIISDVFCKKILEILNGSIPVFGVVKKAKEKFLDIIYNLQNIEIIEVKISNREKVFVKVLNWLQNVYKL